MAILHKATISPTKPELLEKLFGHPVAILGSYRFDDPDGEVGVEAFILRDALALRQVVFTYRAGPLDTAEQYFVGKMDHSVLGARWVYNGLGDAVALGCFHRALLGEQTQPPLDVYDQGKLVLTRQPKVHLSVTSSAAPETEGVLTIRTDLDRPLPDVAGRQLRAAWEGGEAVVATLH